MPTTLNRAAYFKLVEEDLQWLLQQPRSLERDHIEHMLRWTMRENELAHPSDTAQCQRCNIPIHGATAHRGYCDKCDSDSQPSSAPPVSSESQESKE